MSRARRAARAAQAPGARHGRPGRRATAALSDDDLRSDVATDNCRPDPAVLGHPGRQGHRAGRLRRLPRRARDLPRPVGPEAAPRRRRAVVRGARRDRGPAAAADVAGPDRRPRLLEAAVVYGYFPCYSEGNDLVVLHDEGPRRPGAGPLHLPAAAARPAAVPRRLLPARRSSRGEPDVIAFQLVTMGSAGREATAELFAANAYRDYLELHGLSVQLTEALAEYWHARVRDELGPRRRRTPTTSTASCASGYRGCALLLRLPGLPRPRGPGQARARCSSPSASA